MENLASYLMKQLPEGMSYLDAAQLCLRLYSTADDVPEVFRSHLTRIGLADTFAELANAGWIHESRGQVDIMDKSHWVELISAIFTKGSDVVDLARGKELARRIGFSHSST